MTYTFDSVGRNTGRLYPNGSRVTFGYDAVSNRTSMEDSSGAYTYTFDSRNFLASSSAKLGTIIVSTGFVVSNTYDAVGQRTEMRDADGGITTFRYDAIGRTEGVVLDGNRTTISYDAVNRVTTKVLPNNTIASFSYDAASRQKLLYNKKSGGTRISEFQFTYDDAGNQVSVREQTPLQFVHVRVTWIYDESYQLVQEHRSGASGFQTTFTYDDNGNRLVKEVDGVLTTSTFDGADQLISSVDSTGITTYSFDQNGNQALVLKQA